MNNEKIIQMYVICGGTSERTVRAKILHARRILDHYGSVENVPLDRDQIFNDLYSDKTLTKSTTTRNKTMITNFIKWVKKNFYKKTSDNPEIIDELIEWLKSKNYSNGTVNSIKSIARRIYKNYPEFENMPDDVRVVIDQLYEYKGNLAKTYGTARNGAYRLYEFLEYKKEKEIK